MKNHLSLLVGSLAICSIAFAGESSGGTRVSVTRFQQEVDHIFDGCQGWNFTTQNQLQTVLERELSNRGLRVLERRNIRDMYDNEYELPNMNKKTKAKPRQFLAAQYSITGGISELGICEESSANSVQLGGIISLLGGPSADLGASHHKGVSKVKVVAQVLSVETGEILKSFEASSEVSDTSLGLSGGAMGIGAAHKGRSNPPIERATNQAIADLAGQIAVYLGQTASL